MASVTTETAGVDHGTYEPRLVGHRITGWDAAGELTRGLRGVATADAAAILSSTGSALVVVSLNPSIPGGRPGGGRGRKLNEERTGGHLMLDRC